MITLDPKLEVNGGVTYLTKCWKFIDSKYCFEFNIWSVFQIIFAVVFLVSNLAYRKNMTSNFYKK